MKDVSKSFQSIHWKQKRNEMNQHPQYFQIISFYSIWSKSFTDMCKSSPYHKIANGEKKIEQMKKKNWTNEDWSDFSLK